MTKTQRLRYALAFGVAPPNAKKTVRRTAEPAADPEFERSLRDYQRAKIEADRHRIDWRNLPLLAALLSERAGDGNSGVTEVYL